MTMTPWRNPHASARPYPPTIALEDALAPCADAAGFDAAPAGRSRRAHIIGVVVSETTSEIRIATDSVTANSRKRRPTMPPISRIGMNTAISDRLIDSTVKPTSRAPCSAASNGAMPSSMWREVFSSTTIASSTTKPVAIVSAISEKLLSREAAQIHDAERADQRDAAPRRWE